MNKLQMLGLMTSLLIGISTLSGCAAPVPASQSLTPVATIAASGTVSIGVSTASPVIPVPITGTIGAAPTALATATPMPSATLAPLQPGDLSPTELKYRLLDRFPNLFFCDPDLFPVARGDEREVALQRFPEVQKDTEAYQAIVKHNNLIGVVQLNDEQILQVYREYKKLNAIVLKPVGDRYEFALRTGGALRNGTAYEGTITKQGAIAVTKEQPTITTCPICLAATTRIDTPNGPIAVKDLQAGMTVWTRDATGARVVGVILIAAHTPVPATHRVAHVQLDDGRELFVSPGHPTADGRTVGALQVGDVLDNARVVGIERAPYDGDATYDILPSGETGAYWANGILMGSTLR
ncbi:MAG: Hint domain-containing protein [Chloroflexota bacterium]